MTCPDRGHLAKRTVQHYKSTARQKKSIADNRFMVDNIPHQIIYGIIWKYNTSGTFRDKPGSSRSRTILTAQRTRLKRPTIHQTEISLRKVGSMFDFQLKNNSTSVEGHEYMLSKKRNMLITIQHN